MHGFYNLPAGQRCEAQVMQSAGDKSAGTQGSDSSGGWGGDHTLGPRATQLPNHLGTHITPGTCQQPPALI